MPENNIDIHLGKKLRQLRNIKGVSQDALAQESGITFQQVQKYEKGINRISASRLVDFAKILETDITYFFKDIVFDKSDKKFSFAENSENTNFAKEDILSSKETSTLLREYYKIKDQAKRKHIIEIIKAVGAEK
jgi:transcriptional regulator with XRE-family HTH domain